MKTTVQCQCGSAFSAPASLVGQVVKCPVCGSAMTVPDVAAAKPPGGSGSGSAVGRPASQSPRAGETSHGTRMGDTSHGTRMGDTSHGTSHGTRFGGPGATGSGMRTGIRPAVDPKGLNRDLCPRCKAVVTEGGRLCTTCLYELHTGQSAGARKRFKFTTGFGVAIALILIAVSAGGFIVWQTFKPVELPPPGAAPVAANPTPGDATAPATSDPAAAPTTTAAAPTGAAPPSPTASQRPQAPDPQVAWSPDAPTPGVIARGRIESSWEAASGRQTFRVSVYPVSQPPAGAPPINMGTRFVLYRGDSADGTFTQADSTVASETDASGALVFPLYDGQAAATKRNRVYYRISGQSSDGRRLFDSDAVACPVVPAPRVEAGRLKWQPVSTEGELPPVRYDFVVDAPGWEGVIAAQFVPPAGTGVLDVPVPSVASTRGLPVKAVLQTVMPLSAELAPTGAAAWTTGPVTHVLYQSSATATAKAPPQGVVPQWQEGKLTYRMVPSKEAFAEFAEQLMGDDGALGSVISFRRATDPAPQVLELPAPPRPQNLLATPFDRSVRLSWDSTPVVENLARYEGDISLGVFRQVGNGPMLPIATLPVETTSYTDADTVNGMPYRYELRIVSARNVEVAPLLHAEAWVAAAGGGGNVSVLVDVKPTVASAVVAPETGLSALTIAIGQAELAYPYTCLPAAETLQAIRDALRQTPGVRIVERDELTRGRSAVARPGPLAAATASLPQGLPAHLQLRVTDTITAAGRGIELWSVDHLAGTAQLLMALPVEGLNPDAFADAVVSMAANRGPSGAQRTTFDAPVSQVVFGGLLPMDQPRPYFGGAALMDELATSAARKSPIKIIAPKQAASPLAGDPLAVSGAVLVSGRVWNVDDNGRKVGLLLQAIDAATGESLGSLRIDSHGPDSPTKVADWCASLRRSGVNPPTLGGPPSPLLAAESAVTPLHPVWQALASAGAPSLPPPAPVSLASATDAPTIAFGLPLPADLATFKPAARRDPTDPLAVVRPFIGATGPAMLEAWTRGYAAYVQADFDAFKSGIEQAAPAFRAAANGRAPRLVVRGQEVPTGSAVLTNAGPMSTDPSILILRGLLPVGTSGQPLVQYRGELEQTFRQRPYAAHQAWKSVPQPLADPFLRAMVQGVEQGNLGRLNIDFRLPPDLDQYLAAVILAEAGNGAGVAFRKKAIEVAADTFRQLQERGAIQLDARQQHYVTNTMLILLYENDPVAVGALRDPTVLGQYVKAEPAQAADVLRLLVDRIGPPAWDWAQKQPVDWNAFLWQSADEMQLVSDAMPNALPAPLYQQVRSVLGAQTVARVDQAVAPAPLPSLNPINARSMMPQ